MFLLSMRDQKFPLWYYPFLLNVDWRWNFLLDNYHDGESEEICVCLLITFYVKLKVIRRYNLNSNKTIFQYPMRMTHRLSNCN